MKTVNRDQFILWLNGTLLINEGGKIIAVNELECENAENSLKAGETIALTKEGEIVSYLSPINGQYVETLEMG